MREPFHHQQLEFITPEIFCKAGFGAAPKISYLAVICQRLALFEEGSMAIKAKCNQLKLPELPGFGGEGGGNPKRQEAKSRNSASRVHFLFLYPIEISHCGQKTKHQ